MARASCLHAASRCASRGELAELAASNDLEGDLHKLAKDYIGLVTQPSVLRLRRLVIGASHQLPKLARDYYERAPERNLSARAESLQQLANRGLLHIDDPQLAASHFAFLIVGGILDKSLFYDDAPFSRPELTAQANAGVKAFLSAYQRSPSSAESDRLTCFCTSRYSGHHDDGPRPGDRSVVQSEAFHDSVPHSLNASRACR